MNARNHHEQPVTVSDVLAVLLLIVTTAALGALVALEWAWQ